jgi:hypothetical protein
MADHVTDAPLGVKPVAEAADFVRAMCQALLRRRK